MFIRCLDFETTGIPEPTIPQAVVEFGFCDLDLASRTISEPTWELINPGRSIPPEASAIHHIRDRDVLKARSPDYATECLARGATIWCAHKADFEGNFFGGKPLLCTWKAALRVWPDAPAHNLQLLRYWRGYDDDPEFNPEHAMPPHRAGPDAYVCAWLLRDILAHASVDDVTRWSSGPALLAKFDFGKHFGKKWSEVAKDDPGYLRWILDNIHDDRDKRATAKYYLKGGAK